LALRYAILSVNKKVRITTLQEFAKEVIEKIGGICLVKDAIQFLNINSMNADQLSIIEKSIVEGHEILIAQKLSLFFTDKLENHYEDMYVDFHNSIIKDIPTYDQYNAIKPISKINLIEMNSRLERMNGKMYFYFIMNEKKQIIALTQIIISDINNARKANCGLTAVAPEYRNRGIGIFLKSIIIKKLKMSFGNLEILETANSVVNNYILKINDKIGFVGSFSFVVELFCLS
jgi:uncharacterized membrane protein